MRLRRTSVDASYMWMYLLTLMMELLPVWLDEPSLLFLSSSLCGLIFSLWTGVQARGTGDASHPMLLPPVTTGAPKVGVPHSGGPSGSASQPAAPGGGAIAAAPGDGFPASTGGAAQAQYLQQQQQQQQLLARHLQQPTKLPLKRLTQQVIVVAREGRGAFERGEGQLWLRWSTEGQQVAVIYISCMEKLSKLLVALK